MYADYFSLAIGAALVVSMQQIPCAAAPANPLNQSYNEILSTLHQPGADGLVVIDQELRPGLIAAGLRPGDLIQRLAGRRVRDQAKWRRILSQSGVAAKPVKLQIVRGVKNLIITAGPQIGSVHLLAVRAGAAAALGPTPAPRARRKLDWSFLHHQGRAVSNRNINRWFILIEAHYVVGALHLKVQRRHTGWLLIWNLISISGGPLRAQRWRVRFFPGNCIAAPAFTMVDMTRSVVGSQLSVVPHGTTLEILPRHIRLWSYPHAIPMPALFLVADALPRNSGLVMPIREIGFRALAARRGCTLEVMHPADITIGGVAYHADVVDARWLTIRQCKFYFAGHRLIAAKLAGGLMALRVASRGIVAGVIGKKRWIEVGHRTKTNGGR